MRGGGVIAAIVLAFAASAHADPDPARTEAPATAPWCAPELETLPGSACAFDGSAGRERRTLVIFLHGVVEPTSTWQWTQQRGIVMAAKRDHFVALMPKGRRGIGPPGMVDWFTWPTSSAAQRSVEDELVAEWTAARRVLEERAGKPFDEVFVVGFSNGAYYATSLALRGRLSDVDGYAVFAGGGGAYLRNAAKSAAKRTPLFLGIATRDKTTVKDARGLAKLLRDLRWPSRIEEKPVGHAIPDASLDRAIAWLRGTPAATRRASR